MVEPMNTGSRTTRPSARHVEDMTDTPRTPWCLAGNRREVVPAGATPGLRAPSATGSVTGLVRTATDSGPVHDTAATTPIGSCYATEFTMAPPVAQTSAVTCEQYEQRLTIRCAAIDRSIRSGCNRMEPRSEAGSHRRGGSDHLRNRAPDRGHIGPLIAGRKR